MHVTSPGVVCEPCSRVRETPVPIDEYGLSSIQQGMLFHHLKEEHSGVDIEQLVITYNELPDLAVLERAWQATVDRHPTLRSSFHWDGLPQPVQRIHDAARIAIEQHDCADDAAQLFAGGNRAVAARVDVASHPDGRSRVHPRARRGRATLSRVARGCSGRLLAWPAVPTLHRLDEHARSHGSRRILAHQARR